MMRWKKKIFAERERERERERESAGGKEEMRDKTRAAVTMMVFVAIMMLSVWVDDAVATVEAVARSTTATSTTTGVARGGGSARTGTTTRTGASATVGSREVSSSAFLDLIDPTCFSTCISTFAGLVSAIDDVASGTRSDTILLCPFAAIVLEDTLSVPPTSLNEAFSLTIGCCGQPSVSELGIPIGPPACRVRRSTPTSFGFDIVGTDVDFTLENIAFFDSPRPEDSGECIAAAESCSSNADCCSGLCQGDPATSVCAERVAFITSPRNAVFGDLNGIINPTLALLNTRFTGFTTDIGIRRGQSERGGVVSLFFQQTTQQSKPVFISSFSTFVNNRNTAGICAGIALFASQVTGGDVLYIIETSVFRSNRAQTRFPATRLASASAIAIGSPGLTSIASGSSVNVRIDKTSFSNNRGTIGGGAAFIQGVNDVVIRRSSFKRSRTTTSTVLSGVGGAIYLTNIDTIAIIKTRFVDNRATAPGGALFASLFNQLDIFRSVFARNSIDVDATSSNGGAVSIGASHTANTIGFVTTIDETIFRNNVAGANGGALFASRALDGVPLEVTVLRSKFVRNIAGVDGGAIALRNPTFVDIDSPSNKFIANSLNETVIITTG